MQTKNAIYASINDSYVQPELKEKVEEIDKVPAVDNIRYCQKIDTARDATEAVDDKRIPEPLKEQALFYSSNLLIEDTNPAIRGQISESMKELGRKLRNQ